MPDARTASSTNPDLPFTYVGGHPSVDLVNTVDWTARGQAKERLPDYDRLTRWAEGAGVLSRLDAERLRRTAHSRPRAAEAACAEARRVRSVLQCLYQSVAAGNRLDAAWEDFNQLLAGALRWLRVAPRPGRRPGQRAAEWAWHGPAESLNSMLRTVMWSAAELLTSDDVRRLRVCAGPDCGWMYLDHSRNRFRRWCEMETCGTKEKSRRRRERNRRQAAGSERRGKQPRRPSPEAPRASLRYAK